MRVFLQPRPAPAPVTASFTDDPAAPTVERARARAVAVPRAADRVPQPDRALRTGAAGSRRVARRGRVAPLAGRPARGPDRSPPADGRTGGAVADAAAAGGRARRASRRTRRRIDADAAARARPPRASPRRSPVPRIPARPTCRVAPMPVPPSQPKPLPRMPIAHCRATCFPPSPCSSPRRVPSPPEQDELEPPIAAEVEAVTPEPVVDETEPEVYETEPSVYDFEPAVDDFEPVELDVAAVPDQVEPVAFEPAEADVEDLQLADAGAWAIAPDVADDATGPEPVAEDASAEASPAPEEPEWSVAAESGDGLEPNSNSAWTSSPKGARRRIGRGRGAAGAARGRTAERAGVRARAGPGADRGGGRDRGTPDDGRRPVRGRRGTRGGRLRRRALHLGHRSAGLVRGRGRRLADRDVEQRGHRRDRGRRPPRSSRRRRSPRPRPSPSRARVAPTRWKWPAADRSRPRTRKRFRSGAGGRAPGLERARRGAGGLRRSRDPSDRGARGRRGMATRDVRQAADVVIGRPSGSSGYVSDR